MALALRPFSSRRSNEIIAAPKVYGFDTGFVCAHRGWTGLRPDDLGQLWEHYVLNELTAQLQTAGLRYWRDKQGHEVDLIRALRGKSLVAIECKCGQKMLHHWRHCRPINFHQRVALQCSFNRRQIALE